MLFALAGCSKTDKSPDTATPAKAPDTTAVTPCDLTGGAAKCTGLLNASFLSETGILKWQQLKPLKSAFTEDNSRDRQLYKPAKGGQNCYAKQLQRATAWFNPDARAIVLERLPANKVIVMGAMKFRDKCPGDKTYNVGEDLPNDEDNRRMWLVAVHDMSAPAPTYASWKLYQIKGTGIGRKAEEVAHGKFRQCADNHPKDPDTPAADFWNCDADKIASTIATTYNAPMRDIKNLVSCDDKVEKGCVTDAILAERVKLFVRVSADKKSGFLADIKKLAAAQKPDEDPYWITCAVGCCTAEM